MEQLLHRCVKHDHLGFIALLEVMLSGEYELVLKSNLLRVYFIQFQCSTAGSYGPDLLRSIRPGHQPCIVVLAGLSHQCDVRWGRKPRCELLISSGRQSVWMGLRKRIKKGHLNVLDHHFRNICENVRGCVNCCHKKTLKFLATGINQMTPLTKHIKA